MSLIRKTKAKKIENKTLNTKLNTNKISNTKNILICPRCGSTKIMPHPKNHEIRCGATQEAFYSMRICETCGYTGYFFPEVPLSKLNIIRKEIIKLKRETKKTKKSKK
ncbi:MAG: hypothetical protein ACP5JY_02365 [Candidatus Nanoarchaeia archaeon]